MGDDRVQFSTTRAYVFKERFLSEEKLPLGVKGGEGHESVALVLDSLEKGSPLQSRGAHWRTSFNMELTSWTAFPKRKCLNEL